MADSTHIDTSTEDPIFVEEQKHLSEVYAQLEAIRDELTETLETSDAQAATNLRELSEEIRPDVSGADDEVMETLAAIELLNSLIDSYNLMHDINTDRLRRTLLLLRQPYFAKIRLVMTPGRPARDVYIGAAGMTDENDIPLVIDWRSPVAETYYNQENGQTSYAVNGKVHTVELELRRQFDIVRDKLNMYFDTTVAIEDSLLLSALRSHHSEKLRDITATIQREQNEVVRHADVPALLVNGIAGSGKTSVMLQRIAYLLYQERETLSPDQIYLFGPNAVFEHYIDNVLPSMGEANPQVWTWKDFCEAQGITGRDLGVNSDVNNLAKLEEGLKDCTLEDDDLREIKYDGVVLLKQSQIIATVRKYEKFGLSPRFRSFVSDELNSKFEQRLSVMASNEDIQEELLSLTMNEKLDIFGEDLGVLAMDSEEELFSYTRKWLDLRYGKARDLIKKLMWLRLDRVAMRILKTQSVSASELLYLRMLITERGDEKTRFVMIDEVQDYTLTQLTVLARYFRHAHFLMLGDEHQAIREGTATFPEIKALFEKSRGSVDECRLLTSYRSSPEITALFSSLVELDMAIKLASVQREGVTPTIEAKPDRESFLEELRTLVSKAAAHEDELCAIVAADEGAVSWLAKQLGDSVQVIKKDQELPASGVVLLSLRLAKGLEFDEVIIPDASAETYPDTALARRQLYTAISRAMHRAHILAQGELSPLLAE